MNQGRSTLPAISLPSEPISPTWRATVTALIERADTVECWADEIKERAQIAVGGHQAVILGICEALDAGEYQRATILARDAREGILAVRGGGKCVN